MNTGNTINLYYGAADSSIALARSSIRCLFAWGWTRIAIRSLLTTANSEKVSQKSPALEQWQIRTKEFRENLKWEVVVPGGRERSSGVSKLLAELSVRGISIRRGNKGCW